MYYPLFWKRYPHNYTIIADNRESYEGNDEKTTARELYLAKARHKLFEVIHYCLTSYECRFQQISRYHAWPNDQIPPVCESCDNCIKREREKNKVKQTDARLEILDMLHVIDELCKRNDKLITPADVVDIFSCSDNERIRDRELKLPNICNRPKPKILHTKDLVKLALSDLVCRGLVKQTILLEIRKNTTYLTCSVVIEGVMESANSLAQTETWLYWTTKLKI
ncbi:9666_t:CDS:2 [Scutellospora calospora]|uniref:9666_t:CDS:1 n=1 Tax=Scutellospora calospora TaxID=85575 RepID=A0ACA9MEU8_9GLOM|nr:9666_t:CDS:2 [Scutellospora calospora]